MYDDLGQKSTVVPEKASRASWRVILEATARIPFGGPIYNLKVDGHLEYHENAPLVLRVIVVSLGGS